MKNELVLDNYGVQELQAEERIDVDGGGIIEDIVKGFGKYVFKITDNGTLLDGEKGNTDIDLYIFGIKVF